MLSVVCLLGSIAAFLTDRPTFGIFLGALAIWVMLL